MNAIVTGGRNGLLGPVWSSALAEWGYQVSSFDLPHYNMLSISDIDHFLDVVPTPNVLINNAAIDPKPDTEGFGDPWLKWDDILDVNLKNVGYMTRKIIEGMEKIGGGVIINVCSIMAEIAANPGNYPGEETKAFAYNTSKRGLVALTDCINSYYQKKGIRAVAPIIGPFERGLSPKFMEGFGKKFGKPVTEADIRSFLNFAISCEAAAGKIMLDRGYTTVGR